MTTTVSHGPHFARHSPRFLSFFLSLVLSLFLSGTHRWMFLTHHSRSRCDPFEGHARASTGFRSTYSEWGLWGESCDLFSTIDNFCKVVSLRWDEITTAITMYGDKMWSGGGCWVKQGTVHSQAGRQDQHNQGTSAHSNPDSYLFVRLLIKTIIMFLCRNPCVMRVGGGVGGLRARGLLHCYYYY